MSVCVCVCIHVCIVSDASNFLFRESSCNSTLEWCVCFYVHTRVCVCVCVCVCTYIYDVRTCGIRRALLRLHFQTLYHHEYMFICVDLTCACECMHACMCVCVRVCVCEYKYVHVGYWNKHTVRKALLHPHIPTFWYDVYMWHVYIFPINTFVCPCVCVYLNTHTMCEYTRYLQSPLAPALESMHTHTQIHPHTKSCRMWYRGSQLRSVCWCVWSKKKQYVYIIVRCCGMVEATTQSIMASIFVSYVCLCVWCRYVCVISYTNASA